MINSLKPLLARYWPVLYCLAGFVFCFVACYPGFVSADGIDQYSQAISGVYDDWHPPIMAGLWRLMHFFRDGPQPMLAFQLLLLCLSILVLLSMYSGKLWRALIIVFSIAPFLLNFAGYIIKDSQMGLSWLLAISLLLRISIRKEKISPGLSIAVFFLLTYGCWVRINAFTAVLPLCYWLASLIVTGKKPFNKWLLAACFFGWMMAGRPIQHWIFHPDATHPEHKLFMHDLTGIYARTCNCYYPAAWMKNPDFDTAYMRLHYSPATFDNVWGNTDSVYIIPDVTDGANKELKTAWMKAIMAHPGIYLSNRFKGYLFFLRIKKRSADFRPYYFQMEANSYHFTLQTSKVGKIFQRYIIGFEGTPIMLPWFWFFLNFVLLFGLIGWENTVLKKAYTVLVLSGLCYILPQFFIFPIDTDFRYFYWNCIVCSLSIIIRFGNAKINLLKVV